MSARRFAVGVACALGAVGCYDPAHLPAMEFAFSTHDTWPQRGGPPELAAGQGRAFITNNLDDTVTLFDLDGLDSDAPQVLATLPVGFVPVEREGPHHVAVDAQARFAYVGISNFVPGSGSGPHGVHGSGSADGHILKLDARTGRAVDSIRIDKNPGDIRLTPDGKLLLATHFDLLRVNAAANAGFTSGPELDSRLVVIDVDTFTRRAFAPLCPAAHGMAITADSATVITSCLDDTAAILDLTRVDFPVTHVALLDAPGTALQPVCGPYAVTLDDRTAYVSCFASGQLIAVDLDTKLADVDSPLQLTGVAVFGDVKDGVLVVAHQESDGITFIDLSDRSLIAIRPTPGECVLPHVARFSPDGQSVWVVCEGNKQDPGALAIFDATPPYALRASVAVGRYPDDIAFARWAP